MIEIRVSWSNGDTTTTRINATLGEARDYYIGRPFNIGDGSGGDMVVRGLRVELIEAPTTHIAAHATTE